MGIPYIALYPSDYLADTAHLGLTEHGVYWRMLLHYYQHCKPFPNDLEKINRVILASSPEEKRLTEYILCEFFVLHKHEDGVFYWHHARADWEISAAEARHLSAVERGKKGGRPRKKAELNLSFTSAKAEPKQPEPEPEPEPEKRRTTLSGKPDVMPQATALLEKLNNATGRNYKPVASNIGMIKGRLAEYSFDDLSEMIDSKVSEWRYDDKMCKYLRPETLFNATKCAQYVGEIGAVMTGGVDLSKFKE